MSIPKMRWVGLGVGVLGVTALVIGAWQIGLIQWLQLDQMWTAYITGQMPQPTTTVSGRGITGFITVLVRPLVDGLADGNWGAIWGQILFFAGAGLIYWSVAISRKH